jgi:hypothetical protein
VSRLQLSAKIFVDGAIAAARACAGAALSRFYSENQRRQLDRHVILQCTCGMPRLSPTSPHCGSYSPTGNSTAAVGFDALRSPIRTRSTR